MVRGFCFGSQLPKVFQRKKVRELLPAQRIMTPNLSGIDPGLHEATLNVMCSSAEEEQKGGEIATEEEQVVLG